MNNSNVLVPPWKCDTGDIVEFHFSRRAASTGKNPIKGIVVGRETKSVTIHIDGSEQQVRIHISLVKVISAGLTNKRIKRTLLKKFTQKPINGPTLKKEEMTSNVAGMTFKYKKRTRLT